MKLFTTIILFCVTLPLSGQEEANPKPDKPDVVQDLTLRQTRLANRYKQLEQKLFKLYEFEQGTNPDRSKLLKQAFEASQNNLTHNQLAAIVDSISGKKWKTAIEGQDSSLDDLKALLTLLESEDRGKRIKDRQKEIKRRIAEVEKLMRMERGIRGQTEGGVDNKRLAKSQKNAADRAADLDRQIAEDDGDTPPADPSDSESGDSKGKPKGDKGDSKESGKNEDTPKGEPKDSKGDPKDPNKEKESGDPKDPKDPKDSESKGGEPKGDQAEAGWARCSAHGIKN